jgi:hypothetical protein
LASAIVAIIPRRPLGLRPSCTLSTFMRRTDICWSSVAQRTSAQNKRGDAVAKRQQKVSQLGTTQTSASTNRTEETLGASERKGREHGNSATSRAVGASVTTGPDHYHEGADSARQAERGCGAIAQTHLARTHTYATSRWKHPK